MINKDDMDDMMARIRDLFEMINGYALVLTNDEFDEVCREHMSLWDVGERPFMETIIAADTAKRALAGLRWP